MYVPLVFAIIATLIFVGFVANEFFYKVRVPDAVLLILIGILLGPVLHVFDPVSFQEFAPMMASLAVMIILFEAGLNLDILQVLSDAPKGFAFGTIAYFLTVVFISIMAHLLLGWEWLYCLLLGLLLGGTSAAIVIPIAEKLQLSEDEVTILDLESTITNVYNVILTMAIAQIILSSQLELSDTLHIIFASFAVSIFLGFLVGVFWLKALRALKGHSFSYMLTLAVLFFLYAFCEYIKANGPLASLVFGLVLGNAGIFGGRIEKLLVELHREISFFIRVFFFFFLGIIFNPASNPLFWAFGILVGVLSFVARYITGIIVKVRDVEAFAILLPRGLSEAVIASLLPSLGLILHVNGALAHTTDILQLVSITILATNLLTAALLVAYQPKAEVTSKVAAQPAGG